MNNLLYAKYTILLYDLLQQDPTFLNFMELDTEEHTTRFLQIFQAKWGMYEIGGETPEQFKIFLEQDFNLHKQYYIDKLNMYEKDFKLEEGIISTIETNRETNFNGNKSKTNVAESETKSQGTATGTNNETVSNTITEDNTSGTNETQYGLPNKETSNRYPTSKTESETNEDKSMTQTSTKGDTSSNTINNTDNFSQNVTDTETDTNNETMLDSKTFKGQMPTYEIKEKAMASICNIYEEFADRFKECFILLF